jgi:hypothetical protein
MTTHITFQFSIMNTRRKKSEIKETERVESKPREAWQSKDDSDTDSPKEQQYPKGIDPTRFPRQYQVYHDSKGRGDAAVYQLYMLPICALRQYCTTYEFNRAVDGNWIQELADKISITGQVYGVFVVARDNSKMRIINGQHRFKALGRLIKQDKIDKDLIVPVEVYSFADLEAQQEQVHSLFVKSNDAKPMKEDIASVPKADTQQIINLLQKKQRVAQGSKTSQVVEREFLKEPTVRTDNKTKKPVSVAPQRPSISPNELSQLLNTHYKPDTELTPSQVIARMCELNRLLSNMHIDKFMNPRPASTVAQKQYDSSYNKARRKGLYLNVAHSRYPPSIWIGIISSEEQFAAMSKLCFDE